MTREAEAGDITAGRGCEQRAVGGPQNGPVQHAAVLEGVGQTGDVDAAAVAEGIDSHLDFLVLLDQNVGALSLLALLAKI